MNKKAIEDLEKHTPPLLEKKKLLHSAGAADEYLNEVVNIATEFTKYKLLAIEKHINTLTQNWIRLSEEILSKGGEFKADPPLIEERSVLDVQLEVLKKTVEIKKAAHKKYNYYMEKRLIDLGFFNSTIPFNKDIPQQTSGGGLELTKKGIHHVTIKNTRGSLLASYDTRILLSIFHLWEVKGKQKAFSFPLSDLLKAAFLDTNGGNYKKAVDSLGNIVTTSVRLDVYNSDSNHDPDVHLSGTGWYMPFEFGYVDDNTKIVYITLSESLHQNLLQGDIVEVSMMLFHDLETETSKTLYLYILRLLQTGIRSIEAQTLAEQIALYDTKKSRVTKSIEMALEELKEHGVLGGFNILRDGRGTAKTIVISPPSDLTSPLQIDMAN